VLHRPCGHPRGPAVLHRGLRAGARELMKSE
jgi:hypothetical protein